MSLICKSLFVCSLLQLVLFAQTYQSIEDSMLVDTIISDGYMESEESEEPEPQQVQSYTGTTTPSRFVYIGPSLGYIYYDEIFNESEMKELAELEGDVIDSFAGEAKSTEYGICPGIAFTFRSIGNPVHIFVSIPNLSFLIGPVNTYDGSSQSSYTVDTMLVVEFEPLTFTKTNLFISYGFDLGYMFNPNRFSLYLTAGLNHRIWIRSLLDRSDVPDGIQMRNYETYSWLSFPFEAKGMFRITDKFSFGAAFGPRLMALGSMGIVLKARDNTGNSAKVDADNVTLGNRHGVTGSLLLSGRLSPKLGITVSPFFEYFGFGRSNIGLMRIDGEEGHFYEPSSNTLWVGINFSLVFSVAPSPAPKPVSKSTRDEDAYQRR